MKLQYTTYFIRAKDRLNAPREETIMIYGDENQFMFMADLCRWRTMLAPQRLIEFGHYEYGSDGTVSEVYFGGEEITSTSGEYFKMVGKTKYVLSDSPVGIRWQRVPDEFYF